MRGLKVVHFGTDIFSSSFKWDTIVKAWSYKIYTHIVVVYQSVLGIILGGGAGTRLYPLTKNRAKPAVPLGANYRLIDIPISNCINSNITKVYVLTQFNSASLNRHISQAYDGNTGNYRNEGFVEVLAAQQSPENPNWFQVIFHFVFSCKRYFVFNGHVEKK